MKTFLILLVISYSSICHAAIVHHGNFKGQIKVVHFDQWENTVNAPIWIDNYSDDVRYLSRYKGAHIRSDGVSLGQQGAWNADMGGVAVAWMEMTFVFKTPVNAVSALINYISFNGENGVQISVHSRNGVQLEKHCVQITTPDEINSGRNLGIIREKSDIYQFRIRVQDKVVVLDNLAYSTPILPLPLQTKKQGQDDHVTPVPEPATMVLFGIGILVFLLFNFKKSYHKG